MQRVRRGVGVEVMTMHRVMRMRAGAGRSGIHGWRVALLPVVAPDRIGGPRARDEDDTCRTGCVGP